MPLPSLCSALCSWLLLCLWRREDRAGPTGLADRVNVLGPQLVRSCCRLLGVLQRACSPAWTSRSEAPSPSAQEAIGDPDRTASLQLSSWATRVDTQILFIKIPVHMKHYLFNGSHLQPKLVASFGDLGTSHPKTLRLTSLSRLGGPGQLGTLNQPLPINELGYELEWPNVVFTDCTKYDIDQLKYLFQKWSHFNCSNSLSNCYLSSKYGVDDFYQFWINNWENSTDPFIQKLLFLNNRANQCLTEIEIQKHLLTNAELINEQSLNEDFWAFEERLCTETSIQMGRQNDYWLETTPFSNIHGPNARAAEAHFQVLEDRLDASAELEISNHLHQTDWVDWELSNQISHLSEGRVIEKRGGFLLTSGTSDGSGGSSGHGGSGGRGFGGSGDQPPSFGPDPDPAFSLGRLLFYGSVGIVCYLAYQFAKVKVREELAKLLLECQQAQQQRNTAMAQGQRLVAVRPKNLLLKKFILLIGGACVDPGIFISALRLFTIPVWLTQTIRALAPRLLRTLLGSLFSLGVQVISPIVQTLSFGALLYLMNRAIGWACHSFVPLAQPILGLMEGFFICPKGGNMALICVEKQVKMLACTFWFGSFSGRLVAVYRKNKLIFVTLAVFAVGIFTLILKDHSFFHRAAGQIMAQPFAGHLFGNRLGQFFSLFFGCVFLLKSSNFSILTFAFYLGLIYCSQIHKEILVLPLLPKNL